MKVRILSGVLGTTMAPEIDGYLKEVIEKDGSDLHLKVGEPPIIRTKGKLQRLKEYEIFGSDGV
ncbi:hypothetical protein KAW48_09075, partial [candidate division WOR-3 bacterium]|nr:hypothetical protein [candidate division WOR-3 bacterium]